MRVLRLLGLALLLTVLLFSSSLITKKHGRDAEEGENRFPALKRKKHDAEEEANNSPKSSLESPGTSSTTLGHPVDIEEEEEEENRFRTNKREKIKECLSQEEANSSPKSSLESSPGTCSTTFGRLIEEEPRGSNIQRSLYCLVEYVVGGAGSTNHGGCTAIEAALLTQLKQLSKMHSIIDDCLRRILVDIFGSPDSASKDNWNKASRGVKLLEGGLSNLTEAKNLLYNDGFTY